MIIPCCGESSRFPGLKKQFMIHPTGVPLPIFSVSGITGCREHIFVFLRADFEDVYSSGEWFVRAAAKRGISGAQVLLLPEQTKSQVETVRLTITARQLRHTPIYIKDNDNFFKSHVWNKNFVHTEHIDAGEFDVRNKSFSEVEESTDRILRIQERGLITKHINAGGYCFQNSDTFMKYSESSKSMTGAIRNIMAAGGEFCSVPVHDYSDYGTMKAWVSYLYDNYV